MTGAGDHDTHTKEAVMTHTPTDAETRLAAARQDDVDARAAFYAFRRLAKSGTGIALLADRDIEAGLAAADNLRALTEGRIARAKNLLAAEQTLAADAAYRSKVEDASRRLYPAS